MRDILEAIIKYFRLPANFRTVDMQEIEHFDPRVQISKSRAYHHMYHHTLAKSLYVYANHLAISTCSELLYSLWAVSRFMGISKDRATLGMMTESVQYWPWAKQRERCGLWARDENQPNSVEELGITPSIYTVFGSSLCQTLEDGTDR